MTPVKRVLGQTTDDFKALLKKPGANTALLRKALKLAIKLFAEAQVEIVRLESRAGALENEAEAARRADIDARRGLFPYVDAIERFNLWLQAEPELAKSLEPIMRQLEIWQIRVNPGVRERLTGTTAVPSSTTGWNRVPVLSKTDAQAIACGDVHPQFDVYHPNGHDPSEAMA